MFTSVVVAVDGSEQAGKALEIAAELAARDQLPLSVVHVVDSVNMVIPEDLRRMVDIEHINDLSPRMPGNIDRVPVDVVTAMADSAASNQKALFQFAEFIVKQAEKKARQVGVKQIYGSVELGNPAHAILEFARRQKADLIVTGSRGFGPIKSLLIGSTSSKVTQLATCSCLTVK